MNNQSTQNELSTSEIEMIASGDNNDNKHSFTWNVVTGLPPDIGNLTIDSGQTVQTHNTEADGPGTPGVLFVDKLQLTLVMNATDVAAGDFLSLANLTLDVDQVLTAGNLDIYYNPYDTANSYLESQTISYGNGGELIALVPEPSTWAMLAVGLIFLGVRTLRRRIYKQ